MSAARRPGSPWGTCATFLLTTLLSLQTQPARAQSLAEFLFAAAQNNVDNREATDIARQRLDEAQQAVSRLIPSLGIQASWTHNQYSAIARIALTPGAAPELLVLVPPNNVTITATVNVPLIDASSWEQGSAAQADANAADENKDGTALNVQRAVIQAFYSLLGSQRLEAAARESIAASEIDVRQTQDRVRAGIASPVDSARATADLTAKQQALAVASESLAIDSETLERLSGLRPTALRGATPDSLADEAPQEQWVRTADSQLPAIHAAEQEALAADRHAQAIWRSFIPTLAGTASEQLTNATGFTGQPASYAAGLVIGERFDMSTFRGAQAADAAADAAHVRVDRTRQLARDQVVRDWQRVHALITQVQSARAREEANRMSWDILRDRYHAGTANSLDLSIADRDYFRSQADVIQVEALLAAARAGLRLSAGLPWNAAGPTVVPP
jgi:outer membrane protein TolC